MTKLLPNLASRSAWLSLAVLTACLAAFLQPAQARTYNVIAVDVPFEFMVGTRTFAPGHYDLVPAGNGLLSLRNARKHTIAALITRSVESNEPLPTTKLVFTKQDDHQYLSQIWIENEREILEVLKVEVAIRQPQPSAAPNIWFNTSSFFERNSAPRMTQ